MYPNLKYINYMYIASFKYPLYFLELIKTKTFGNINYEIYHKILSIGKLIKVLELDTNILDLVCCAYMLFELLSNSNDYIIWII
jgi:hypothetical protein